MSFCGIQRIQKQIGRCWRSTDTRPCFDLVLHWTMAHRTKSSIFRMGLFDTAFLVLAQKVGEYERAKAEFDQYAQQQEARIKELQDNVNEIYSHWNEY